MPTKTYPKGFIMTTQTRRKQTSLAAAASVNAKLGASVVVIAAGYVAGGFISLADTAASHAARNPGGKVSYALTTRIKDQWEEAREKGYQMVEDAKDVIDFSNMDDDRKEEAKS